MLSIEGFTSETRKNLGDFDKDIKKIIMVF